MIVGFNFTKILVERNKPLHGNIKVTNDLRLERVEKRPLPLKEKKDALVFEFVFTVDYEPGVGKVLIGGDVLYIDDQKKMDSTLSTWEKNKKIPPDVSLEIVNIILARCNIKTLELANELNLPAHLPMPKINIQDDPRKYIG